MTPERYSELRAAFHALLSEPPESRAAAIDRVCMNDSELRVEVERLLSFAQSNHRMFDTVADKTALGIAIDEFELEAGLDDDITLEPGVRVGPFTIRRLIERGGMGDVYEATQNSPRRSVALKTLRRSLWSTRAAQRFRFEVEALGRLRHGNVAAIYHAGVHRDAMNGGRIPYFAMEYIEGALPILEYTTTHRVDRDRRIELFLQACDGVQCGHQQGLIHRDLKPSNLLVGADGRLRVIDFGIASSTDADLTVTRVPTTTGAFAGTVHYMSPEQLGAIDHTPDSRSDVFSLGLVLYELLTNTAARDIDDTTVARAVRQASESEPVPPSHIDRRIRGDLEAIVLKAISREPSRRYRSAGEFADDLRRWRAGDAPLARRPRLFDAFIRFIRRHPVGTPFAAAAVLSLAVFGGSLFASYMHGLAPYRLEVGSDHVARMKSRADLELWSEPGVSAGAFIDLAPSRGGGRAVVLTYDDTHFGRRAGSIVMVDPRSPGREPIWERPLATAPQNPPSDWMKQIDSTFDHSSSFRARRLRIVDIDADAPGDEIVLVSGHTPEFPTAIQILDQDGALRFQIWHKGDVNDLLWEPEIRRLIFVGRRNDWRWRAALNDREAPLDAPLVIGVLDPSFNLDGDRYVYDSESETFDPSVVSYAAVWPPDAWNEHLLCGLRRDKTFPGGFRVSLDYSPGSGSSMRERGAGFRIFARPDLSETRVVASNSYDARITGITADMVKLYGYPFDFTARWRARYDGIFVEQNDLGPEFFDP
ncbi:MAG: serine/threonine protein kinase [Phycisphaerales bacterium]